MRDVSVKLEKVLINGRSLGQPHVGLPLHDRLKNHAGVPDLHAKEKRPDQTSEFGCALL